MPPKAFREFLDLKKKKKNRSLARYASSTGIPRATASGKNSISAPLRARGLIARKKKIERSYAVKKKKNKLKKLSPLYFIASDKIRNRNDSGRRVCRTRYYYIPP